MDIAYYVMFFLFAFYHIIMHQESMGTPQEPKETVQKCNARLPKSNLRGKYNKITILPQNLARLCSGNNHIWSV